MDGKKFKQARKLINQKGNIHHELEIWKRDLTSRGQLAYKQSWNLLSNRDQATSPLNSVIPEEMFNRFREEAMKYLQGRLQDIDDQVTAL